MQVIYGLIGDNGDGSSSMDWYRKYELVEMLLDPSVETKGNYECYWSANESGPAETLTFPDDLDLEAAGFRFKDEEIEANEAD